jgi:drug/metabolite transporter (DMT)-like permease
MTKENTLRGITLVVIAMAVIPLIDVIAKILGQQNVPIIQVVWARFFFGAIFTLPLALRAVGAIALRPINFSMNALRAACLVVGTWFFFMALKSLPVADALAIYFVQPILITALSPLLLGEHVGIRRWVTVMIGFVGVIIIIRPGFQAVDIGVIYALLAGLCSAIYILVTRHLSGTANAMVTTFQTSAIGAIPLTLLIPVFWLPPESHQWLLMILLGAIAIFCHALITRAYDFAEASLLSPFNFTEIITAVIAGWYFFGDFPDRWTFAGAAILIGCAIYISWREQQRKNERSAA